MVMMISDETGEGKMTVHQILPGIMICFTDMHMEQCTSEFELNSGQKVLCIDQCREGRIEMKTSRESSVLCGKMNCGSMTASIIKAWHIIH